MDTCNAAELQHRDGIARTGQRYAIALIEIRKRMEDVPTLDDQISANSFTNAVVECADMLMRVPS